MKILGISAYYHDSAACILENGKIVAAAQEERFTRKKHDSSFPVHAISSCLEISGSTMNDIEAVAFYDKPFLKFERILESYLHYAPKGFLSFIKSMPIWLKKKLWIKDLIKKELNFDGKIFFPEHHLSHAASAFFPSPFKKAAIITLDGVGEWTTTSYGIGQDNNISMLGDINFPHSLGLLYSAFTYYLGFKVNSGEYKVMGLAPYGEPVYVDKIKTHLIDIKDDGSFKMNMKYFNYITGLSMTNKQFEKLFGQPRRLPDDPLTQFHMDMARSVQAVTEEIILKMARYVKEVTGEKYLCLAGGVALNCVANGKILETGLYNDIWIQPAAGDAGGAVGAALAVWHLKYNGVREVDGMNDAMNGAYLGPEFSETEIESFLNQHQIPYSRLGQEEIPETIADLINEQAVIGWFQGRMEFGPRALGSRSIIGDARNPEMQKKMNLKIKFRESFRPFAPSVLIDHVADYFELDRKSPYMLLVANVQKEKLLPLSSEDLGKKGLEKLNLVRSKVPAITHVDNSARIQTVHPETNPLYYKMIETFNKKYGCPVIINTSFNVRGEPIVCSPEDAYNCFMRTEMDYLIMGPFLLEKSEMKKHNKKALKTEVFELD